MDEKKFLKNNEEKKEDNYRFVNQVIKKKSIRPKDVLIRLGCIAGSAVLFGLIAAFVFVQFLPIVEKEEETASTIDFEEDHPAVVTEEAEPDTEQQAEDVSVPMVTQTPDSEQTVPPVDDSQEQGTGNDEELDPIAAYSEMYDEMQVIAQNAMPFMVNVTGISSDEDWFSVQNDNSKQASGLIIAENGPTVYILTEYKTVDTVDRVVVTFCDNSMVDGRYHMHDPNTGLTILKVDKADMSTETRSAISVATLGNSYRVYQGDAVIAIGSPMGYSNSVVYGQITSTTNTISTWDKQYNMLTTNMLGNSSGNGVLINLKGEVIGVVAQSFGNEDYENIIIGLPISQLKSLIEKLSNGDDIPYIGIKGQSVTEEVANQTGMPKGIYVSAVKSNSPAFDAGIRNGDIITQFEGEDIGSISQYTDKLFDTNAGAIVDLTIMRKSTEGYREFDFKVVSSTW